MGLWIDRNSLLKLNNSGNLAEFCEFDACCVSDRMAIVMTWKSGQTADVRFGNRNFKKVYDDGITRYLCPEQANLQNSSGSYVPTGTYGTSTAWKSGYLRWQNGSVFYKKGYNYQRYGTDSPSKVAYGQFYWQAAGDRLNISYTGSTTTSGPTSWFTPSLGVYPMPAPFSGTVETGVVDVTFDGEIV